MNPARSGRHKLSWDFWLSPSQKDGLGSGDTVARAKVFCSPQRDDIDSRSRPSLATAIFVATTHSVGLVICRTFSGRRNSLLVSEVP